MRSFWSGLNSGLLFISLTAWIGGAIILASSFKDSMKSDELVLMLILAIFLILIFHSFWGMLVEMSKNIIESEERYENLKSENKKLKDDLKEISVGIRDISSQLRVLICQSGAQNNSFGFSGQEIYWNCKFCGTVNSSDEIICKKCGMNKLSDVFRTVQEVPVGSFENDEQNKIDISGDELSELNYVGQNAMERNKKDTRPWKCNRCGNFNPASSVKCSSCGQQKSGQ